MTTATLRGMDRSRSARPLSAEMAQLRLAEQARAASRRMIARGQRPAYRVDAFGEAPEIRIRIAELPWLSGTADRSQSVLVEARRIVAGWLEVDGESFDIEGA
jgi:hypothetical protein